MTTRLKLSLSALATLSILSGCVPPAPARTVYVESGRTVVMETGRTVVADPVQPAFVPAE